MIIHDNMCIIHDQYDNTYDNSMSSICIMHGLITGTLHVPIRLQLLIGTSFGKI